MFILKTKLYYCRVLVNPTPVHDKTPKWNIVSLKVKVKNSTDFFIIQKYMTTGIH